jgi:membrane protease YdiL (CAAX protease family)
MVLDEAVVPQEASSRRRELRGLVAVVYLIYWAESFLVLVPPPLSAFGILLHFAVIVVLLGVSTLRDTETPFSRLLLSLVLVPLIRVLSLAMPLTALPPYAWYVLPGLPILVATVTLMRIQRLSLRDVGLSLEQPLVQVLIAATGIPLGIVEYAILQPAPLVDAACSPLQLALLAVAFIVSTGYIEELVFRGVLQRRMVRAFGAPLGVLGVTVVFAALHIGWASLPDFLFVFAIGLLYGTLVHATRSITGVAISHGLINVLLFLVMPGATITLF